MNSETPEETEINQIISRRVCQVSWKFASKNLYCKISKTTVAEKNTRHDNIGYHNINLESKNNKPPTTVTMTNHEWHTY